MTGRARLQMDRADRAEVRRRAIIIGLFLVIVNAYWVGIALWTSRRHLIAFVKHVFGRVQMDDSREPMRYRSAAFLLLLSFAALVMIYFWFPVMVSWLIKSIILKHGGRGTHRKAIPFFLGLVLGDYIPRSIASITSLVLNIYMPSSGAGHTL